MNKRFLWRLAAVFSFAVMLVINGLAGSTTVLGGWNTAAVSAAYPTLFTPAGYTFAIWGVIYALLVGHLVYQFGGFGKVSGEKQKAINTITPLFVLLSCVNIAWIFAWQYSVMWLAVMLIVGMLALLARINETLRSLEYSPREYAWLRAPFSIYYGWLTVATVANICVWLVSVNWDAWGVDPVAWLITILWVAAAIGVTAILRNKDWAYGLVFVWAYIGILLSNEQLSVSVVVSLAFLVAVFAAVSGYVFALPPQKAQGWRRLFKH